MLRKGKKRLAIDLPQDMHRVLKEIAKDRNIPITTVIIRLICKLVKEQEQYDNE